MCTTQLVHARSSFRLNPFLLFLCLRCDLLMPFYRQYFQFHIEFLLKIIEWNVIFASKSATKWNALNSQSFVITLSAFILFPRSDKKKKFPEHVSVKATIQCDATKCNNRLDKNVQNEREKKRWERKKRSATKKKCEQIKKSKKMSVGCSLYTVTNFRAEWKIYLIYIFGWRVSFPVQ